MQRRAGILIVTVLWVVAIPIGPVSTSAVATPADPCAVIDSCSLGELAARSGIEFGFFYGPSGDPTREALSTRHSTMYTNHAFSWRVIEPSRGVYNFGPADANAAFAEAHGLRHQGFHFAWDNGTLDDSTMERLGDLGLEVYVSELDVPVGPEPDRFEVQAARYRVAAESCLAVAACTQFFIWGLDDSESWLDWFLAPGLDPLVFDAALQPKPAYDDLYRAFLTGRPVPASTPTTGSTFTATTSAQAVGAAPVSAPMPAVPAFTG